VVEAQGVRVREHVAGRQAQLQQFAQQHEEVYGDKTVLSEANLEGLSPRQVKELVERKKQLQAQNIARRLVLPEMADPEKAEAFMDKWGSMAPEVGATISSTDRDPSVAVPVVAPVRNGTPFRGKKR